ncbi:MAG: hypothetical protein EOP53_00690 [Sphingobacteriales bacterium]|nr:MAG: hypothetical protein EOP53_00690 [Sphingobacteriales bacterium]
MIRRKLTISQIIFIVINILPVLGVWFQGWDAARIFLFYCLETILTGIFHVVKMIAVMLLSEKGDLPGKYKGSLVFTAVFIVCFFIMHYGIFVYVQTSMFFSVSGIYKGDLFGLSVPALKVLLGNEGMLMIAIFIVYYIIDSIRQLTFFRIEKISDIVKLMFQPYGRIFIQQFVVIFASMFLSFGLGNVFIVVFVLTRLYVELFFNFNKNIDNALEKNESLIQDHTN